MIRKPCIECGQLTNGGTRCEQHQTILDQHKEAKRNTPQRQAYKRQMYGPYYRRQRKAVIASATICGICNKPFKPDDRIEADHIYPGQPTSPLQAVHRLCNQKRGAKPL
jgi:hypothetical protein